MMDWPEWFRLAGIWLEQQGRRVAAITKPCASLSPGRPRKLETAEMIRIWAGRTITPGCPERDRQAGIPTGVGRV